jgi:hypothetical protein
MRAIAWRGNTACGNDWDGGTSSSAAVFAAGQHFTGLDEKSRVSAIQSVRSESGSVR